MCAVIIGHDIACTCGDSEAGTCDGAPSVGGTLCQDWTWHSRRAGKPLCASSALDAAPKCRSSPPTRRNHSKKPQLPSSLYRNGAFLHLIRQHFAALRAPRKNAVDAGLCFPRAVSA
eukprot:2501562-Rhodomonas_salina.4